MKMLLAALVLFIAVPSRAQTTIRPLSDILEGHHVGGVSLDAVGDLYIADFGDIVWKITPDGERTVFAAGLYGTSGNAVDAEGNRLVEPDERVRLQSLEHGVHSDSPKRLKASYVCRSAAVSTRSS